MLELKMTMIKTRVLILSDTHGRSFASPPITAVDVAIHCGDLTECSKLSEFRAAIMLLKNLNAPLKLVIAGNHDFSLDDAAFARIISEARPPLKPELVAAEFGQPGEALQLVEDAKEHGIMFLDEGNHEFKLQSGACLKVYASPYTPGDGGWGFQYSRSSSHDFDIAANTDLVVTHGPPMGVFDRTHEGRRAGCAELFKAVARVRPAIHCFGHIHEAWGAKRVRWKPELVEEEIEEPSHFNAIDNERSEVVQDLVSLRPSKYDTLERTEEKLKRMKELKEKPYAGVSAFIRRWSETYFVNASLQNEEGQLTQKPFCIEIDLPKAE